MLTTDEDCRRAAPDCIMREEAGELLLLMANDFGGVLVSVVAVAVVVVSLIVRLNCCCWDLFGCGTATVIA